MSEDWYRNRDWTPEIETAFEQRIARSRAQKAQHLMLQGQALIANHPGIAVDLLKRSIALENEFHLNQANCYLALARLALGEIEAALQAYEAALEAQLRFRFVRSSAPLDYAFAVAWFGRSERYSAALPMLEAMKPSVFPGADLQAHAAHALILDQLGRAEDARTSAKAALADMPEGLDEAAWAGISFGQLRDRLEAIAATPA